MDDVGSVDADLDAGAGGRRRRQTVAAGRQRLGLADAAHALARYNNPQQFYLVFTYYKRIFSRVFFFIFSLWLFELVSTV